MVDKLDPFYVPELDEQEINAILAVYEGVADPAQQRMALLVIENKLCQRKEMAYRQNKGDTDFLLGRMYVGQQIKKYRLMNPSVIEEIDNARSSA